MSDRLSGSDHLERLRHSLLRSDGRIFGKNLLHHLLGKRLRKAEHQQSLYGVLICLVGVRYA